MCHHFRDPIYGMIQISEAERKIIDTPVFQRLRYIRQLGTSYLVYHGAEHTRFGHSLGVMELSGKAMDILKLKQPEKLPDEEYKRLRQIVRIVALLHDVGHAPFSHVGENSGIFPIVEDYDGEKVSGHEVYSRLIVKKYFKQTIESNFPDIKVEEILSFMKGNVTNPKYFFAKDLISGQLDMDRMDYLLRDSHYCGVKYGLYDLSRLLDTLTICEPQKGVWQLGIESDGVQAVEEFVFARYWMFIQVYFHKTRRIFDYFLVNFLKECLQGGKYPTDLDEYVKYNDNYILEMIANSNNKWAKYLRSRKHLKEVFVSTPHQYKIYHKETETNTRYEGLKFDDYHKLGWIDEEFKKTFPLDDEPENYYIDQAKTASAKEQIEIKTELEEATDFEDEENQTATKKLYAIPVKDKHSNEIKPIQEYSLPIQNISNKKINIIRIYASSLKDKDKISYFDKVKEFCNSIDARWQEYVNETLEVEKKFKEAEEEYNKKILHNQELAKKYK